MAEETIEIVDAIIAEDPIFFYSDVENSSEKFRIRPPQFDYFSTRWMGMLRDPHIIDENSRQAKLFRLRFRTPFLMFRDFLMSMVREAEIFPSEDDFRVRVPLGIKVLLSLWILGRGNCADDLNDLCGCHILLSTSYSSDLLMGL